MSRKTFLGVKEQKDVFWGGEEPLGGASRNVHDLFSLKLAGSFPAGSPHPDFSSPHPCSPVLPPPPPWTGWLTKGRDVHTPAPSTLKRWGSPLALPLLCAFGLGCISSSLPCAFLCLCSLISHDFANYTLLLSDLLLAPNSRKRRGDVETLHLSTGNWNSF